MGNLQHHQVYKTNDVVKEEIEVVWRKERGELVNSVVAIASLRRNIMQLCFLSLLLLVQCIKFLYEVHRRASPTTM